MNVLKFGERGDDVRRWQYFLTGLQFEVGEVDGIFGEKTRHATIAFQRLHQLQPDGIVGNKTAGTAMALGFDLLDDARDGMLGANWPPKPDFRPLLSHEARASMFGHFSYRPLPLPRNPENIEVLDGWIARNIVRVEVPQLIRIKGGAVVYFHRLAAGQLIRLWHQWEQAGLLHHVLTWGGAYAPRFVRGSRRILSNHAFGTAFDINYEWNRLGMLPALVGQRGSVRELVSIAHRNGFYWGGHFSRSDGMHFEVAWLG